MRCTICKKSSPEDICMDCRRKINSNNYMIEYCDNCLEIICLSQEKVRKHKYKLFIGICPKCGYHQEAK